MKSEFSPVVIFATALLGALFFALICVSAPEFCTLPVGEKLLRVGDGWCFEFWLNRYQTLLAALLSLTAALIAATLVWRQARLAEEQIKVTAGLIAPDFWMSPLTNRQPASGEIRDQILVCANQNRRMIEIISLRLSAPTNITFGAKYRDQIIRQEYSTSDSGSMPIGITIPGTRPNAPEVNRAYLELTFTGSVPNELVAGGRTLVEVDVHYKIFAPRPRFQTQRVEAYADVASFDGH